MAKLFDKMRDMMFGEYEDEDEEFMDEYEDEVPPATTRQRESYGYDSLREKAEPIDFPMSSPRSSLTSKRNNQSQVVSIHTNVQMMVVIIKPEVYEDAQDICDQIKAKKPVVINLEKVEYPVAQRIMDFLSGTCYSLEGSIQRVANNIFIIAPENVDITGDFKEELKTKGILLPWATSVK